MTKLKCWTKPRIPKSKGGAGGTYTTCEGGQKKKKPKAEEPKKKKLKRHATIEEEDQHWDSMKLMGEIQGLVSTPPRRQTELEKFGLTREQANKMNPLELFGMLPSEMKFKILTIQKPLPLTTEAGNLFSSISKVFKGQDWFYKKLGMFAEYEGGNFNSVSNSIFEKQQSRLYGSFDFKYKGKDQSILGLLTEITKNKKFVMAADQYFKKYDEYHQAKGVLKNAGDEEGLEEYWDESNLEDEGQDEEQFGLVNKGDWDYYTTTTTRREVRAFASAGIKETKEAFAKIKQLLKLIADDNYIESKEVMDKIKEEALEKEKKEKKEKQDLEFSWLEEHTLFDTEQATEETLYKEGKYLVSELTKNVYSSTETDKGYLLDADRKWENNEIQYDYEWKYKFSRLGGNPFRNYYLEGTEEDTDEED